MRPNNQGADNHGAVPLVRVRMICTDLASVPVHAPPAGIVLRHYQRGDVDTWTRIQADAEPYHAITANTFAAKFGADETLLRERQLYACTGDGIVVGTVTAWFDDNYYGRKWGRLHWLAVMRAFQGRGLGLMLASQACRRLLVLGHHQAYLVTQTVRTRAIRIYLALGFCPDIRSEADRKAWALLQETGLKARLPQV